MQENANKSNRFRQNDALGCAFAQEVGVVKQEHQPESVVDGDHGGADGDAGGTARQGFQPGDGVVQEPSQTRC